MNAIEAIGGSLPLTSEEFARRAYAYALNPNRNALKEVLDQCASVEDTPPLLGIFNDIPWHRFRESEAHAWAKAGFSWVVNDAEHSQWEGWYGREQNAAESRRSALRAAPAPRSTLPPGDVYQAGARAALRPYSTTCEDAERFFRAVQFFLFLDKRPADDRGGYPVRSGDRTMMFTPDDLRNAKAETQGWIQFETAEYIMDRSLRDRVLDLMVEQGRNKACGFVGPFDAILREGKIPEINDAVNELFRESAKRGLHMGRVVGSGSMEDPKDIETPWSKRSKMARA